MSTLNINMNRIIPTGENIYPLNTVAQVIDLDEEKKIEKEVQALMELHDFIKAHPDSPVKDIARFMPPVDARVVSKTIQALAIRDQSMTAEEKETARQKLKNITVEPQVKKWGKKS
jgi:ABC-type nitrate/sulfonate/bicarbonate transport system substrate-binding protein